MMKASWSEKIAMLVFLYRNVYIETNKGTRTTDMGCNCQRKIKNLVELLDNEPIIDKDKDNILFLSLGKFGTFLFTLLSITLFIAMAVPLMIYIIICMLIGKQPTVILRNIFKNKNGQR